MSKQLLNLTYSATGHITKVELGDYLEHSDEDISMTDEFLSHYGVPGMKWGKRKARDDSPNANYSSRQRQYDEFKVGKRGVKKVNRYMNDGDDRKTALKRHSRNRTATSLGVIAGSIAVDAGIRRGSRWILENPEKVAAFTARATNAMNGTKAIGVGYDVVQMTLKNGVWK